MMSYAAGEVETELSYVSYFEASCLTFSNLIFDLKTCSGLTELLEACSSVEKKMKSNDELKKLVFLFL